MVESVGKLDFVGVIVLFNVDPKAYKAALYLAQGLYPKAFVPNSSHSSELK